MDASVTVCPLCTASAIPYLPVWIMIAGKTEDGDKNLFLYICLKTFWIN